MYAFYAIRDVFSAKIVCDMKCMMNLPERYVCVLFSKLFYSGNVERYDTIYSFITARLIPQIIHSLEQKKQRLQLLIFNSL